MGMNVIPLKDLTLDKQKVVTLDVLKNINPFKMRNHVDRLLSKWYTNLFRMTR